MYTQNLSRVWYVSVSGNQCESHLHTNVQWGEDVSEGLDQYHSSLSNSATNALTCLPPTLGQNTARSRQAGTTMRLNDDQLVGCMSDFRFRFHGFWFDCEIDLVRRGFLSTG